MILSLLTSYIFKTLLGISCHKDYFQITYFYCDFQLNPVLALSSLPPNLSFSLSSLSHTQKYTHSPKNGGDGEQKSTT